MVTFKVIFFLLSALFFSIYGIDMEKLHPFSLALIISKIYCLDSLKMFGRGGGVVPLPDNVQTTDALEKN